MEATGECCPPDQLRHIATNVAKVPGAWWVGIRASKGGGYLGGSIGDGSGKQSGESGAATAETLTRLMAAVGAGGAL